MSWHVSVTLAETVISSGKVPPSEEIISLIKRVNPTSLNLSETDRQHGYGIKNRLQNLLLENYGEVFQLTPHPCSPDIILIKHLVLPSIDACHAEINALSPTALDKVGKGIIPSEGAANERQGKVKKEAPGSTPNELLRNAELLLAQYEYPQAEELLASLRITHQRDLPVLLKAIKMLAEDIGVYPKAIATVLAQPKQLLRDKAVRELLALTYYGNGMIPEARALLDGLHESDLGKNALSAYAEISYKDGNLAKAYYLLNLSERKEGFVTDQTVLRKGIETAMLREAEPFLLQAEEAFQRNDLAESECLLQKALCLYPKFQKALEFAGKIEATKSASELKRLWEGYEAAEIVEQRLELLAQLMVRDRANGDKIRRLMAVESSRQKREAVAASTAALEAHAAKGQWSECFDLLTRLSREADEDELRRACSLSPYFSAFYGNRKLARLPGDEAKQLWLRFVKLKELSEQGQVEGSWELVQELKPYFQGHELFQNEWDRALAWKQEQDRTEAERLLTQLEDLDRSEEGISLDEARRLAARIKERLPLLPVEESTMYRETAQRIVRGREPEIDHDLSIFDYRDALSLGNLAKAAQLRESQSWPEDLLEILDNQVAEEFAISAEPIAVVAAPDLAVDLGADSGPSSLRYFCASDRHILLRENDETIVVINLERMCAARYTSPNFQDLVVADFLPSQDVFLFINEKTKTGVWRAILSETESRFTANFEVNEHFQYGEGACFNGLYISSGKDNAYYTLIEDCDGARFVKQHIGLASGVERCFTVTGASPDVFRLSYQPDRFLIITESDTTVLEGNVTPTRGCSRVGTSHTLDCLGIDRSKSLIYAFGDGIVNVLNTKLRAVKQYLNAAAAAHMTVTPPAFVCVERSTALLTIDGKGIFYNLENNKFSQKFWLNRILRTETPSRWYYWDFDATNQTFLLKDITDEVDTLLEWQVLLPPGDDEAAAQKFVEALQNPEFFTL